MTIIKDRDEIDVVMQRLSDKDPQRVLREIVIELNITEPSKIIFLDIDGVLNHEQFLAGLSTRAEAELSPGSIEWSAHVIDEECVSNLNMIIERTGSVVIVSSSWRQGRTVSALQAILDCKGFAGRVVGVTPEYEVGAPRRDEIADAIDRIGDMLVEFVILDDDEDAGIEDHFVWTKPKYGGLTKRHAERAVSILGESETRR